MSLSRGGVRTGSGTCSCETGSLVVHALVSLAARGYLRHSLTIVMSWCMRSGSMGSGIVGRGRAGQHVHL